MHNKKKKTLGIKLIHNIHLLHALFLTNYLFLVD